MDPDGYRRVREAFEESLALSDEAGAAHLRAALGDAPELLRAAEAMLAAHRADDGFLTPPGAETLGGVAADSAPLAPGTQVGEFELVRPIGAGGMGEVWEARQERPRRLVALKALRTGLATPRARRRFAEEADVLARLSHPNIAQVLASGVLEAPGGARPWLALELIEDARTLTEYGAEQPPARRLALLRDVCAAVHHGHLRGVVHRDLKPDNCLVDGEGRVRVIDFGIARVVDAEEPRRSVTVGGEIVGTIAYMSPEQVLGRSERVDVRTDVHALGVLLYELLTGRSPWTSARGSWTALAREVCEVDPPPPSARVPGLSPELDWIVAKALAKEPERRYASAQELGEDLRRYAAHEPLLAGPLGVGYRARKFARRNRAWVLGGALAAGLLVLGIAGTTFGLLRALDRGEALQLEQQAAEEARGIAEERLERAEAINRFLDSMLRGANPMGAATGVTSESTVGEMLDRAAAEVATAFPGRPDLEADTRLLIGVSYHGQGRLESAREHLLRARDLLLELQPERAYDLIKCRRLLATVTARLGDPERALEDLRRVHADAYATLSDDYPELGAVDSDLAWMLQETGALSESIPYGEAALARFVALGPDFAPMAAAAASNLVRTRRVSGSPEEIEAGYRQALELIAAAYGPRSVQAGVATSNLGNCLLGFGRLDEARALFEEALAVLRDALVGDHPTIAVTLYNLSALQQSAGELDAAERTARECLAANERLYGPDHPETLDAVVGLALILYERGELSAALEQFQLAADTRGRDLGPDDPSTVKALARALEVRCLLEAGPGGPGDPGGPDGDGGHQALLDLYARVAGDDELMRFVARAGARAFDELDPERAQAWRARAAASD